MRWFNAERLKAILTFPVETVNLVHDGTDFIDKDWAEFTAQMYSEGHSFFTYTSDSVDSLSSCCFDGSQRVRYRDKEHEYETTFAEIPNSGVDFDSLAVWHMGNWKPAKFISLPSKTMLKITVGDREVICTSDHLFPVVNQDGTLQAFDYHARDLVVGDLIPVWYEGNVGKEAITSISPYTENDGTVYCFEISDRLTDTPYFTLANGVITHNCRLKSGITDNTFSYTLGAGGVATGSKSVMTINLNRLVQNVKRKNPDADLAEISEAVREQVKKIHKYQTAFNEIIKENFKARLLPVYDAGFISLEKQYLTTGINGGVEAAEFLGIDIGVNDKYFEFFDAILKPIYEENKAARMDELMWNTEFVPAENLGVKNATWDKKDGYVVPRDCYNSYFYKVEDETCSVVDKFVLHGNKLTKYLDGGSALHCNLSEHLDVEQYRKLLKLAIKTGCSYFTFNIPNTICNDCGHISKHYLQSCEKCGSENVDFATRVIGYLKRVSKFSEARIKEANKRYYADA